MTLRALLAFLYCSSLSFDVYTLAQIDVQDYFSGVGLRRRPLRNPLAAEFGVYSKQALDDFIKTQLSSFTLVGFLPLKKDCGGLKKSFFWERFTGFVLHEQGASFNVFFICGEREFLLSFQAFSVYFT